MKDYLEYSAISSEEKRTVKWFLTLFYIIYFTYDIFYYYLIPTFILNKHVGPSSNHVYFVYAIILLLLPLVKFLKNFGKLYLVKYLYLFTYILTTTIADLFSYYSGKENYTNGNMVEVFLLLTSPLFINNKYFWAVSLGILLKYVLIGVLLSSSYVLIPVLLIFILSIMAFILLKRFQRYVQALKSTYDEQLEQIVKGIIATLELKDPYTRGHSERVAYYSVTLAKEVGGFSEEELNAFCYACLLHDIGKINIPDSILMKPAKLTKEEFDIVKTHPSVGAAAIQNVQGLGESINVVLSHHERWDGNGYPDKLAGEEIPLLARITSIADAFDAMTSSRSYRVAMTVEEAEQIIIEGSGSQFDPKLVLAFKAVLPLWKDFHNHYPWIQEKEG